MQVRGGRTTVLAERQVTTEMSILTEILRDMYVDPELLEQLSMEQRDVLFRKMREEQIRRWRLKEDQLDEKERVRPPRRTATKVKFVKGTDGKVPWVWVMGEHKDDLSYEELVRRREEEEMERERQSELELRKEAEELAKNETRQIISLTKKFGELKSSKQGDLTNGMAVGEKSGTSTINWTNFARSESELPVANTPEQSPQLGHIRKMHNAESEEQARRKTLERRVSIIGSTDKEQREYEKKRADEVFSTLLRAKRIAKRRAQEIANKVEQQWKESEQKAKDYERLRRTSFKKARELTAKSPDVPEKILEQIPNEKKEEIAHRMSARRKPVRKAPLPPDRPLTRKSSVLQPGTAPKTFTNVVRWFQENEAPRGVGKEKDGSISVWFHGKLTRNVSQKLLDSKPAGSYLVRLSTKIWGYTVSVQSYTGVKHFLVDASVPETYHFLGPKQQNFKSISDLLGFYRVNPITWAGQEVLLLPVGQEDESSSSLTVDIFEGLYSDDDMATDTIL